MNCYPRVWVMKLCSRYFPACILLFSPPHQQSTRWIDAFNSHSRIFATTLSPICHQPIYCDKEGTYAPRLKIVHAEEKPMCSLPGKKIRIALKKERFLRVGLWSFNRLYDWLNLKSSRPLKGRLAHPCKLLYTTASMRELSYPKELG